MRPIKFLIPLLLLLPMIVSAQTILPGSRGGTGYATTTAGNIGTCLEVNANNPLTYTFGACSGGGGGSASSTLLSDNNTFSGINTFNVLPQSNNQITSPKLLIGKQHSFLGNRSTDQL